MNGPVVFSNMIEDDRPTHLFAAYCLKRNSRAELKLAARRRRFRDRAKLWRVAMPADRRADPWRNDHLHHSRADPGSRFLRHDERTGPETWNAWCAQHGRFNCGIQSVREFEGPAVLEGIESGPRTRLR